MNKDKIISYLKNPMRGFVRLGKLGLFKWMSDEMYLRIAFRSRIGKKLDLKNPQTFNEKLQWLKLYDRKPIYTTMVDKYEAKKYVASIIGDQYIIPTLGVWDKFEDIDFDKLPNQFVLKCTHDSGGLVICRDKSTFDYKAARKKITSSLKRNFFWSGREWPYKNVKPRIIAEKYMENESTQELVDYKLMCFQEKVKFTLLCTDRFLPNGLKITFYDMNWDILPFGRYAHPRSSVPLKKPSGYDEMVKIAEKLSKNIPFLRVDFYMVENRIYFGEMTLYPGSGFEKFKPEDWDKKIGDWLKLPEQKTLSLRRSK